MKTKKKKINKDKKHPPEIKQVFDWTNMPHAFGGHESSLLIAGKYDGAGNDTYHRWYPDRITEKKFGYCEHFDTEEEWEAGKLLQDWLLDNGMIIKDEFCFHVLIHISW
jgi:hypothetical protein